MHKKGRKRCPIQTNDEYSEMYQSKILIKLCNFEIYQKKKSCLFPLWKRGLQRKSGVVKDVVLEVQFLMPVKCIVSEAMQE